MLKGHLENNVCLKCGKENHKWYECWTKNPVRTIVKVDGGRPKAKRAKKGNSKKEDKEKEIKISAMTEGMSSEGRIIELPDDSDEEYALLKNWGMDGL